MKNFRPALILISALLALPNSVGLARTYYVFPSGSNRNPGTESQPWQTIQKAADSMVAGDTVIVRPGVYPERVNPKASGTAVGPITYKTEGSVTNYGFDVKNSFITIDGFNIVGNTVTPSFSGAIEVYRGLDSINILNNKIHDFDPIATKIYGIHFYYASSAAMATANCVISNNVFRNTSYLMVGLMCSNAIVCNNVFDFANTHDAIHCFGAHITICDNLITNMSANPLVPDHTDIIQTFGDEPTEAYDVVFERNFVVNCNAQLCQLEQKGRPNIRDWTFRNNVWVNVRMGGNCDIENIRWYNNTFYRCTTSTAGPILLNCNVKGCSANAQVFNNIFFECGHFPSSVQQGWYHPETTDFTFFADYNFVCGTAGARKGSTFAEVHGINGGDPRFVDPENLDFRLRADSPLINRGRSILGFNDDQAGTLRPQDGPWDIGAFEFGSGSTQNPRPQSPKRLRIVP